MKKLLMLAVSAFVFSVSPAMAEDVAPVKRGEKFFEKMDLNADGSITKEEFISVYEARYIEMDADANGSVTREEAKAHADKWREQKKAERAAHKKMMEESEVAPVAPAPAPDATVTE